MATSSSVVLVPNDERMMEGPLSPAGGDTHGEGRWFGSSWGTLDASESFRTAASRVDTRCNKSSIVSEVVLDELRWVS